MHPASTRGLTNLPSVTSMHCESHCEPSDCEATVTHGFHRVSPQLGARAPATRPQWQRLRWRSLTCTESHIAGGCTSWGAPGSHTPPLVHAWAAVACIANADANADADARWKRPCSRRAGNAGNDRPVAPALGTRVRTAPALETAAPATTAVPTA